jgi:hypothetical protein
MKGERRRGSLIQTEWRGREVKWRQAVRRPYTFCSQYVEMFSPSSPFTNCKDPTTTNMWLKFMKPCRYSRKWPAQRQTRRNCESTSQRSERTWKKPLTKNPKGNLSKSRCAWCYENLARGKVVKKNDVKSEIPIRELIRIICFEHGDTRFSFEKCIEIETKYE